MCSLGIHAHSIARTSVFTLTLSLSHTLTLSHSSSNEDVAVQMYHVVQMLAFAVMATLIMRLKLLLTPQLAVLTSLLPTAKVCHWLHPLSLSLSLSLQLHVPSPSPPVHHLLRSVSAGCAGCWLGCCCSALPKDGTMCTLSG